MTSDNFHGLTSDPAAAQRNKLTKKKSSLMAKNSKPLAIPARISSINAATNERCLRNIDKKPSFYEHGSKAQEILGTHFQPNLNANDRKKHERRPSVSGGITSETKLPLKPGLVPFSAIHEETEGESSNLRPRASSPLLGREYRSHESRPSSLPKERQHPGSFNLNPNPTSTSKANNPFLRKPDLEPHHGPKETKEPKKESKGKTRPHRLDLSLLFPKPQATKAPLLSPQRMTKSPSPISVRSGSSPGKNPAGKAHTKTQPGPGGVDYSQIIEAPVPADSISPDWADASLEKKVKCTDIERALQPQRLSKVDPIRVDIPSKGRKTSNQVIWSEFAERTTTGGVSSRNPVSDSGKESYLDPNLRFPFTTEARNTHARPHVVGDAAPLYKKSSKDILKTVDLRQSSFLFLSSSEDEGEEEGEDSYEDEEGSSQYRSDADSRPKRTVTYREFPQVPRSRPTVREAKSNRLDRSSSTSHHGSHRHQRRSSLGRRASKSSTGTSSTAASKGHSQRGRIPTISESEVHPSENLFPRPRGSSVSREADRRSRIMVVTREEESLLEAMRNRKGKITPSLFREAGYKPNDPEQGSMLSLSGPSRSSFYGGDTSFLRLSPVPPLPTKKTGQDASHADNDSLLTPGASSDVEKTAASDGSRRTSLVYSESLPSSTSGASPLTPVLPIYRFSPIPSQKSHQHPPPQQPLPAIPQLPEVRSKQRATNRNLLLDSAEEEDDEFPIWAYGWCNELGSVASTR